MAKKNQFKRTTPHGKGLKESIKGAKTAAIKVGILSGTGEHPNADKGQTIAEIAWWNEFGTVRNGVQAIPARPFLRTAMAENRREYMRLAKDLLRKMLTGKISAKKAQGILGLTAQSDVRNKITSIRTPSNAPETIARKKSSNPLIDTGAMRQHINWAPVD
jgi:hypothetical protein